jgi:hypothetical protein
VSQVHEPSWRTAVANVANISAQSRGRNRGNRSLRGPHGNIRALFALLIIGHGHPQLLWFEVTRHPTAEWLAQQIVEAFRWDTAPTYLVRDNDRCYGQVFLTRLRSMGIRDHPTAPRSPWQNAYVERLIGSLRRECLDHMLILRERHLRRVLKSYFVYYNEARTHLGLDKETPLPRPVRRTGSVGARPVLFGLHHCYDRT